MSGEAERKTGGHSLERIRAALLVRAFVIQFLLTAQGDSLANDEGKHLVTSWWLLKHMRAISKEAQPYASVQLKEVPLVSVYKK
jgi:hypothetical protein